jgi:hypothetical protein
LLLCPRKMGWRRSPTFSPLTRMDDTCIQGSKCVHGNFM